MSSKRITSALVLGLVLALSTIAGADSRRIATPPAEKPPTVVMIPASEEPRIAAGSQGLIVMTREDLDELVRSAYPPEPAHRAADIALESGKFEASADASRMRIRGTLRVRGLAEHSWAEVTTAGLAVSEIRLDGTAAAIYTDGSRHFVRAPAGDHVIEIAGLAPVATSAGRRRVSLQLPRTAALELTVSIPGTVIPESDAPIRFASDADGKTTLITLTPPPGERFTLGWHEPSSQYDTNAVLTCQSDNLVLAVGGVFETAVDLTVQIQLAAREKLVVPLPERFSLRKVQ